MSDIIRSLWHDIKTKWDLKTADRPWNFAVDQINTSQILTYLPGTTGFLFTNTGVVSVRINGKILFPSATPATAPGDSVAIAAHKNDVFKGIIKIVFTAGAGPSLEVLQVYYMDVKQR